MPLHFSKDGCTFRADAGRLTIEPGPKGTTLSRAELEQLGLTIRDDYLSLLKSPSGSELTLERPRASARPMAWQAETRRIGSVVAAVGIGRTETTRTRGVRTVTIRHGEDLGQAARV